MSRRLFESNDLWLAGSFSRLSSINDLWLAGLFSRLSSINDLWLAGLFSRLSSIRNLVTGKQLMCVLLKLFGYCLKVKINRKELIKVEMNTITIMLGALNLVRASHIFYLFLSDERFIK